VEKEIFEFLYGTILCVFGFPMENVIVEGWTTLFQTRIIRPFLIKAVWAIFRDKYFLLTPFLFGYSWYSKVKKLFLKS
jgi:hypothetical protein